MIYLLGVSHKQVQVGQSKTLVSKYVKYLTKKVKMLDIGIVCEEYSSCACAENNIKETTTKRACAKMGIKHKYCDPSPYQRNKIGIPSEKTIADEVCDEFKRMIDNGYDNENIMDRANEKVRRKYYILREKYWLRKIKNENNDLIFVCGSSHMTNFLHLLDSNGLKVQILDERFDKTV